MPVFQPADPTQPAFLIGSNGADLIQGFALDDTLVGGGGDDDIKGNDGDDRLFGGKGNDTLNGGEGSDHLSGDQGDDELQGAEGNDRLYGGMGNDLLYGQEGYDWVSGDAGADTFGLRDIDANDPDTYDAFGILVDNFDVFTDVDFAEGDSILLEGFETLVAAAGLTDGMIDNLAELQAIATAAGGVTEVQNNSVIMYLVDDNASTHALRLMDYSAFDFV